MISTMETIRATFTVDGEPVHYLRAAQPEHRGDEAEQGWLEWLQSKQPPCTPEPAVDRRPGIFFGRELGEGWRELVWPEEAPA